MLSEQAAEIRYGGKTEIIGGLLYAHGTGLEEILRPKKLVLHNIGSRTDAQHLCQAAGEVAGADVQQAAYILYAQIFPVMAVNTGEKIGGDLLPASQAAGRNRMLPGGIVEAQGQQLRQDVADQKIAARSFFTGQSVGRRKTFVEGRRHDPGKEDPAMQVFHKPLLQVGRQDPHMDIKGFHRSVGDKIRMVQRIRRQNKHIAGIGDILLLYGCDAAAALRCEGNFYIVEQKVPKLPDLSLIPVTEQRNLKMELPDIGGKRILL